MRKGGRGEGEDMRCMKPEEGEAVSYDVERR